MKRNETFIVKTHFVIDNGEVPCGSILKIKDFNIHTNEYIISITPYLKNGSRETKEFVVTKEFISKYGEK